MALRCRLSPFITPFRNSRLSGKPNRPPLLTLFTKKNEECSLCDEAKEMLKKYSTEFAYEEKYIDDPTNESWFSKYRYDIPVVHINGEYLMKHRVNEKLLTRKLRDLNNEV